MSASGPAPPLTRTLKAAYGVGSLAESAVLATLANFVLLYYNQVRGVPAHLVGLVVSASLVLNALVDPLVGSWSDRTRSRLGRRHPFMFAAILPITGFFYAIFSPPLGLGPTAELVWLSVCTIVLFQAVTVFHTPHLALGGELSGDYLERSTVMSYNTFFLWVGGAASWTLAFSVFLRGHPGYPNGALDPAAWPPYVLTLTGVVFAALVASTWFTRARIPYLPTPGGQRFGGRELARDIGRALGNRNYVWLLVGYFFLTLLQGARAALWLYTATFYWRLTSADLAIFVFTGLVGYVLGSAIVGWLHRVIDKRWTLVGGIVVYSIFPALPLALGLAGVLTPSTPGLLLFILGCTVLEHLPLSLTTTTVFSALADIADENELKYGLRQEGVLYATRTFFSKVDQAVGSALAGWVLTAIAFPAKAVPGHVAPAALHGLALAFVATIVPGLVAAVFYGQLGVTRDSHAAVKAALAARPQGATAG